jgi:D-alanine-D-alanine ligase
MKTRIAVLFGGRSPEHDVSVVTGLQALQAIDQERFSAFPVYVATDGNWFVGEALRDRSIYLPSGSTLEQLDSVTLDICPNVEGYGRLLLRQKRSLLRTPKPIEFDVALLAFHGLFGEDGRIQGLLEIANVPYTGMRPLASSICMDKAATKRALARTGINLLPSTIVRRPASGFLPSTPELEKQLPPEMPFPVIVKPVHLGSSIGVAKASNAEELRASLPSIFRLDTEALIEPFVQNLAEYNVAIRMVDGIPCTSAIEMPKPAEELLDFKAKYLSADKRKTAGKTPGTVSQGMLSLTRDINPKLPSTFESKIRQWAQLCFAAVNGTGAPRIDFLSDEKTGELWLNEVNPCPGSLGFFLWEAAETPLLFTNFLSFLIDEAFVLQRTIQLPSDPTQPDARLFKHP